ncbi:MAG: multicopper oxidase domain-containing protein [Dehalococcoidales bacterium]|nr:multicopper oxidase domain-containing protein [Dehalococcoidales bacterium]
MTIAKSAISRRDFFKYAGGSIAVLVVGSKLNWVFKDTVYAAVPVQTLDFHITDAIKEMHTHNAVNTAECYLWVFQSVDPDPDGAGSNPSLNLLPECPGPTIMATKGDTIHIKITNDLPEPHAFSIPGLGLNSVPDVIPSGECREYDITATQCGAFLYYDNLNEPVNRMMGLHGAVIILPTEAERAPGHNLTPYDNPTPNVQALFDSFGTDVFPGLAWEEGDATPWALNNAFPEHGTVDMPNATPFRHYLWLLHQASPRLFAEVGDYYDTNGAVYPAQEFMDKFLRGDFVLNNNQNAHSSGIEAVSYKPQYFTVNGQSGFFAHDSAYVTPMGRVGEPVVIYILNAGLWLHSMHLHANHFYVTDVNQAVQENPIWVDVFNVHPMDRVDYVVPFMRPPDVPNQRGIGRPDPALGTCWPPLQEMNTYIPDIGEETALRPVYDMHGQVVLDGFGQPVIDKEIDLAQRLSPLCYPMHDHSEPSQTSQGGNYNTGLISGIYFTGDRNTEGHLDFPMEEDFWIMFRNYRGCEIEGTHPAAPPHDDGH